MKSFLMRLLIGLVNIALVLVVIATVSFVAFRTSYDLPKGHSSELRDLVQEEFKLDEPLVIQYLDYLIHTFTGDFYSSTGVHKMVDVGSIIQHSLLPTLFLLLVAVVISVFLGLAWGSFMKRNSENILGKLLHIVAISSLSFPILHLAVILFVTASNSLCFLSIGNGFDGGVLDALQHAVLPSLSVVVACSGFFALVTRAGLARAGQLGIAASPFRALDYVNPLPYFLFPLAMIGVLTVDWAYSYEGLGVLIWDAILLRDVQVLMACFFIVSVIVFFSQLLFRAARERTSFMLPVHGILGPSGGNEDQVMIIRRPENPTKISLAMLLRECRKLAGEYTRHRSGVAAISILAVILIMGLFADVLSTVPDPWLLENHEPNLLDERWFNPLPPSLSPSPYTGFLHPLGTDARGRDMYSMNLYAAGTSLELVLVTAAVSVLCGMAVGFLTIVAVNYTGLLSRLRRCSMTVVSQAFLAILPTFIPVFFIMSWWQEAPSVGFLLVLAIYLWIYRAISWPVADSLRSQNRAGLRSSTGSILKDSIGQFRAHFCFVLSRTLSITKYVVVFMALLASAFLPGLTIRYFDFINSYATWQGILLSALDLGAYYRDAWWWIIPPFLGIVALTVSSYFFLDALEKTFAERVERSVIRKERDEGIPDTDDSAGPEQLAGKSAGPSRRPDVGGV